MFYESKSSIAANILGIVLIFGTLCAVAWGWIANIITIAHATAFSGMVVLRVVGIFVLPLGTVLGYIS